MEKEIIITEGKKPFWKIFISSLLFTISIFLIGLFLVNFYEIGFFNDRKFKGILGFFELSVLAFVYAVRLAITKTIFLNIEKKLFRSEYQVVFFKTSWDKKFKELKYISIFKNDKDLYEINLWYDSNKHINMFISDSKESAVKLGELMSDRIKINLFDATEKGNSKWIIEEY